MQVLKDSDASVVRINYLKLSRMVHPDKCSLPQAADASAVLNQAKDTLDNPLKKRLYDAYVSDVTEAAGAAGAAGAPDMTYAEWEAAQATQQVKIPVSTERRSASLPATYAARRLVVRRSRRCTLAARCMGCFRPRRVLFLPAP